MYNPLIRLVAALALLLAAGLPAVASGDAGTSSAVFLKLIPYPTAGAMGAYNAVATGNEAMHFNPAGLTGTASPELTMVHNDWMGLADYENISVALPGLVGPNGTLGFSLAYLTTGDVKRTTVADPNGLLSGDYSASDLMFSVGYGHKVSENFAVGGTLRFLRERLWTYSDNAILGDIGVRFSPGIEGLTVGASVLGLGQGLKFVRDENDLPTTYMAGLAYRFKYYGTSRVILAVDGVKPSDENFYGALGLECEIGDYAVGRVGYSTRHDVSNGFTCGFGVRDGENWFVDYAYTPQGKLGNTNRVSLTYRY